MRRDRLIPLLLQAAVTCVCTAINCHCKYLLNNDQNMFAIDKMRILTVMGPANLPNRHYAIVLIWALLLLQVCTPLKITFHYITNTFRA